MRRPREDAEQTREQILEAALNGFFNNGFKNTSLEAIANDAGVTRGAIYWHFANKEELYIAVVNNCLESGVVEYARSLPADMTYADRICSVFLFAQNDNQTVDFIYKAMHTITHYDDTFQELKEAIQLEKIKLLSFFAEETRFHIRQMGKSVDVDIDVVASDLFLLFEGLFLTKNIMVGLKNDDDSIRKYVEHIIRDLI